MREEDNTLRKSDGTPITVEEITEQIKELWYKKKPKDTNRKMILYRQCDTFGWIESFNNCGNPECYGCEYYKNLLIEAVEENFKTEDE